MAQRLRSPYVLLLAFGLALAAPSWATPILLGVAGVSLGYRALRLFTRRHSRAAPAAPGSILLGTTVAGRRQVTLSPQELTSHGLILGASGSGKTTALVTILDQQIRLGRPVVALDMKGSPTFSRQLAAAAEAAGRPFKLWTPDGPISWNPLQHGNATELKDKLISTERFTEPHYQRAAERYLQNLLQVLQAAHPGESPTLSEVVELMDSRRLPALLRQVSRGLAERVQDYLATLTPDQVSAIRGLQSRLAIITESHTGERLAPEPGGLDLREALDGREVVLFSLNSSRYGQLAAQLGTLAVQDLVWATGNRLEQRVGGADLAPATIAIDEFSGIGGEHVVALFARGREAGVGVYLATQEMADLARAGRGVREQVLGNTAVKLAFRQDVPESAQVVAQIAGTETVWEETRQITGTLFRGGSSLGTRHEAERFVVHPNQIKSLRTGEAIMISKHHRGRAELIRVTPTRTNEGPAPPAKPRSPMRGRPVQRRVPTMRRGSRWPSRAVRQERSGPELG